MKFESNEALTTFLETQENLTDLVIENSPELTNPTGPFPRKLTDLTLTNCSSLSSLPPLPSALKKLRIDSCDAIANLPPLPETLTNLLVYNSSNLASLPPLPDGLLYLRVENCATLATLPALPAMLTELGEVRVYNCPAVTRMGLRVVDRIVDLS